MKDFEAAEPASLLQEAIDPFSLINKEISRSESSQDLERYRIPRDLPLVLQAGRFDKWKDPQGVIEAFCIASKQNPATLVLAGNSAADDPEGPAMYERICALSGERILIIAAAMHCPSCGDRHQWAVSYAWLEAIDVEMRSTDTSERPVPTTD